MRVRRPVFSLVLAATSAAFALPASAQPAAPSDASPDALASQPPSEVVRPPRFGARGEWVISGSSSVGISSESFSSSSAIFTNADFDPTVDWFVARDVSVGLTTHFGYADDKGYGADGSLVDTKTVTLRLAPRVGVNLPLGKALSLWPTASFGFEWLRETQSVASGTSTSVSGNPLGYPTSTDLGPWGEIDVALLWHVQPHFFLGITAGVFHDFGTVQGGPEVGGEETELSGGFLLGGWFGGRGETRSPAPPGAPSTVRRFGQEGEVVLSNEIGLGGYWGRYAGSNSSFSSESFTAGVDYFLADILSLGGAVSGFHDASSGIDATTGGAVTSSASGASFLVRLGVAVPLGSLFSLWPRLSLGASTETLHEAEPSQGTASEEIDKPVFVSLYVPLLVHPATHFFVGLGPSISSDLSHPVVAYDPNTSGPGPSVNNNSTTVGAGLVVGGWL